jgi:hypothetical protein
MIISMLNCGEISEENMFKNSRELLLSHQNEPLQVYKVRKLSGGVKRMGVCVVE